MAIGLVSFFWHEIGHSVAALYYGITTKGMGIGLYMYSPVFNVFY